jgi:hypothetical protein
MKLTYWVSESLNDSCCYNVRAKTKKEVIARLDELGDDDWVKTNYGKPFKVSTVYVDAFHLMTECLEEGGGYWEIEGIDEA